MSEKGREQERPPLLSRWRERERGNAYSERNDFFSHCGGEGAVVVRGRRPWTISEWDLPFDFLFLQHLIFLTEWIGNNTQGQ